MTMCVACSDGAQGRTMMGVSVPGLVKNKDMAVSSLPQMLRDVLSLCFAVVVQPLNELR